MFHGFNRWLDEDWGCRYEERIFAVPYVPLLGEHVWVTPFWEDDVGALLGDVRVERLLLGSDWPHAEGTATPADFVSGSLADLPEGAVRRVARDNALELLGLQVT